MANVSTSTSQPTPLAVTPISVYNWSFDRLNKIWDGYFSRPLQDNKGNIISETLITRDMVDEAREALLYRYRYKEIKLFELSVSWLTDFFETESIGMADILPLHFTHEAEFIRIMRTLRKSAKDKVRARVIPNLLTLNTPHDQIAAVTKTLIKHDLLNAKDLIELRPKLEREIIALFFFMIVTGSIGDVEKKLILDVANPKSVHWDETIQALFIGRKLSFFDLINQPDLAENLRRTNSISQPTLELLQKLSRAMAELKPEVKSPKNVFILRIFLNAFKNCQEEDRLHLLRTAQEFFDEKILGHEEALQSHLSPDNFLCITEVNLQQTCQLIQGLISSDLTKITDLSAEWVGTLYIMNAFKVDDLIELSRKDRAASNNIINYLSGTEYATSKLLVEFMLLNTEEQAVLLPQLIRAKLFTIPNITKMAASASEDEIISLFNLLISEALNNDRKIIALHILNLDSDIQFGLLKDLFCKKQINLYDLHLRMEAVHKFQQLALITECQYQILVEIDEKVSELNRLSHDKMAEADYFAGMKRIRNEIEALKSRCDMSTWNT